MNYTWPELRFDYFQYLFSTWRGINILNLFIKNSFTMYCIFVEHPILLQDINKGRIVYRYN